MPPDVYQCEEYILKVIQLALITVVSRITGFSGYVHTHLKGEDYSQQLSLHALSPLCQPSVRENERPNNHYVLYLTIKIIATKIRK